MRYNKFFFTKKTEERRVKRRGKRGI